jgi:hypothetical protein
MKACSCVHCLIPERLSSIPNCDTGVTQNLPAMPQLTLLTQTSDCLSITYVFAIWTGEFGFRSGCHNLFFYLINWHRDRAVIFEN